MDNTKTLRGRLAAFAGMAGGAMWIASGALHITNPESFENSKVDTFAAHLGLGLMAAALLLTAPALIELARNAQTQKYARAAGAGMVALAVACTVSNIVGDDPLFFIVVAPLSNLAWLVGSIGTAVSLKRAGTVAPAVAYGLPLVQILSLPGADVGGPILGGAYWVAVGYLLSVGGLARRALQPATA